MIARALIAVWLIILGGVAQAACRADAITLTGPFGTVTFDVELADTPQTRAQGLMFRDDMPAQSGMLFVYEQPRRVAFWMKNTLIPLDMIFLDARGVVRKVHENAIPHDETAIPGDGPTLAVLEINGGLASKIGIAPGALARHEAFANAAWPCP